MSVISSASTVLSSSAEKSSSSDAIESDEAAKTPQSQTADPRLYAVVWRWHFYAGLLCAPILWLVLGTGAIYVFRTEISAWRDKSLQVVEPTGRRLSYDELREHAAAAVAPHEIEGVMVHPEDNRSVKFVAHLPAEGEGDHAERHQAVFVNPYTGDILGTRIEEDEFFAIVLKLHRSLMLGVPGRIVTELVTCWGLLLLGTGVYLWWPRGKKNVGVWLPRVRGKLYAVLRDWHAVGGVYLLPLAALVMGTGLCFTQVWGTGFNTTIKQVGHWAPQWFSPYKVEPPQADAPHASLDALITTLLEHSRPYDSVALNLEAKPGTSYKAWLLQDENKNSYRMVAVDPYTAETIAVVDGSELPFMYRVRLWAVSIHMGQIFGWPTKILAFVTAVGLLVLSVTGVWMWWQRRPVGRTGFPRRPGRGGLPLWGWGVIAVSGMLMPVAGISMVLVAICDRAWAQTATQPRET
ncbi:PepSY domain-containing protein [bacterium]|nr:PepSY domain-containing protein [bacterium]